MTRLARVVISELPHHVTQRGNRRDPIFFEDGDQEIYRDLLAEQCLKARVEIWTYCLMPSHVHLIAVPRDATNFARAIGEAHRHHTNFVNARGRWHGHLFQSRFASVPMDERHLHAWALYVSLNPVRARLVARAEDWPWSSVRAHLTGRDDGLVRVAPLLERIGDFARFLSRGESGEECFPAIRNAESTGRPLGTEDFVKDLERRLGRPLARRAPGRKPAERGQPEML